MAVSVQRIEYGMAVLRAWRPEINEQRLVRLETAELKVATAAMEVR